MTTAQKLVEAKLSRFEFTLMLSMTMAVVALSIDMILPALGDVRIAYGLPTDSNEVAGLITFLFLGLGIGQMVWGPVSDALGRKTVLYLGLGVYILAAIAAAMAPSLGWLFIARFISGIGGAGPQVIARSVVRDVYTGSAMAHAMSFIMAVFLLIPIVAPTLGTLVLLVGPWEWIFVFTALFGVAIVAWTIRLPETLAKDQRIPLRFGRLASASQFVLSNPMTMGYTLAQATAFGFFASYLASSQLIVDDIFGLDAWFPVIFGVTALIMGAAMLSNTRALRRFELRPLLRMAFSGYLVASIVFAGAMLATDGHPSFGLWAVTILPILLAHSFLIPNLNAIAMVPMGAVAGTAAAIVGTASTLGGAVIGLTIDRLYDGTLVPFGVSAAIIGTVAYGFMLWADHSYRRHYPLETGRPQIGLLGVEHA
jgi:MFS transporter, DHA1 family, multidrug resistance protein